MEHQNHFQVHLLQNTAAYKQKSSSMPAQKKEATNFYHSW